MSKEFKKIIYWFLGTQAGVFAISFIYYNDVTLLNYINISFYFASILLFTSLLIYTVNSGFFDAMSYSFRTVFTSNDNSDGKIKSFEDMTPLSEMVNINTHPLLVVGLMDFALMLASLYVYYL
jgi:hypothetical protein